MGTVSHDVRVAARLLLRTPRFTIPAVVALALGIGATTSIVSLVRGIVLEPLPYRDPDRVVSVWEHNLRRNRPRNVIGPANFVAWRERQRSFDALAMVGPARLNLVLDGQPEEVAGLTASSDIFRVLGVEPALGRPYVGREDEEGHDDVIVLGYEFWRNRLGGRPDVLGTTMLASGRPRTVIGVMPPRFTVEGRNVNFLVPYGWTLERLRAAPGRGSSHAMARLADGVSFERASADMKAVAAQLEKEYPRRNAGWSVSLVPVHEQTVDAVRPALMVLTGAALLVLLVAAVNVANLLLARATTRQRELGIRTVLGAGRGRLLVQLLTESALLGLAGGAAGMALAAVFHRGLVTLVSNRVAVPRLDQVSLDPAMMAFAVGLSLLTGLAFGLVPALVASHGLGDALRDGGRHGTGRRARRMLSGLVVAEIALSLVLLTGAGLLLRSFVRLQQVDPGFRATGLYTGRVQLPPARYDDERQSAGFYTDVVARIAALPGVTGAAAVSFLPFDGPGIGTSFYRADRPRPTEGDAPIADVRPVTPGFFRTMGIPQRAGRDFAAADRADTPRVAIVNESMASLHFPGEDPLGRRLNVSLGRPERGTYEIVGVVGDIKLTALDGEVRPTVYVPHTQLAIGMMSVVVRTGREPLSLATSVAGVVREIDPELPVADVRSMEDVIEATLARPRVVMVLLGAFAIMGLVLAGVGVYGVMAYAVAQRTQEIGVRMALGATPESIFRLVLGHGLTLTSIGVAAGLAAAAAAAGLLEAFLFDTPPLDPFTFGATAALLASIAFAASYVPARRGTRVAPVEALRTEG